MQPTGRKPPTEKRDPRAKMTAAERARAVPPSTEVDRAVFDEVLRRLVTTPPPAKKRSG